jgi:hypothetical protein
LKSNEINNRKNKENIIPRTVSEKIQHTFMRRTLNRQEIDETFNQLKERQLKKITATILPMVKESMLVLLRSRTEEQYICSYHSSFQYFVGVSR